MVALYAAAAGTWILASDLAGIDLADDIPSETRYSLLKGLAFVVVTSTLLYLLLARVFGRMQRLAEEQRALRRDAEHVAAELQAVQDAAPVFIAFVRRGRIERISRGTEALSGYTPAELVGKESTALFADPDEAARVLAESRQALLRGEVYTAECLYRYRDGSLGWVRISGRMVVPGQFEAGSVWITEDINQLKAAEGRLRASETRYRTLFDASPQPTWVYDLDTLRFLAVNDAAIASYGYSREEFAAMTIRDIRPVEDLPRLDAYVARRRLDSSEATPTAIGRHRRKSGAIISVEVSSRAIELDGRRAELVVASDVTERLAAEARLAHLAQHDALTDLPNRLLLTDRMNVAIAQAQRSGRCLALMFMDLDRFKSVNDSLGHDIGDRLLREVAARLKSSVRAADTASRQGGDEFLVMLPDLDDADDAARVADKLVAAIAQPFRLDGTELVLTVSIGIACFPDNGRDAETLLRNADAAMYAAKDTGRNCYRFYSTDMNARAHDRLILEADLRRALERQQLFLAYQPQLDLASGAVVGLEALLRWNHPHRGVVPPGMFIPIAEDSGLIAPIGAWVLQAACRQHAAWHADGLAAGVMAVNVSAYQFRQADFVATVEAALTASGLPSHLLELEVTESVVMQGVGEVTRKLGELDALGVQISIDDFGTGYSSLAYLKQFPISRLKIDQSFTRGLPEDHESSAIAQAVISLGHSLGLNVLAEGIETEAQADFLRSMQCDAGQGYLYERPMPAAECTAYLQRQGY
ncbi:MAG: putative bifunctional diguanylate cyclase/phosphodiesterase [Burkholderiales bacterium]